MTTKPGLELFMETLMVEAAAEFGWEYTWFAKVERDLEAVELKIVTSEDTVHGYRWMKTFVDLDISEGTTEMGFGNWTEQIKEGIEHIRRALL